MGTVEDCDKIKAAIARFPATFGLRAFPGNLFRIGERESYVSTGGAVMLYTQRLVDGRWQDFAKGTEAELRREIV